jgi:hypothetical protein
MGTPGLPTYSQDAWSNSLDAAWGCREVLPTQVWVQSMPAGSHGALGSHGWGSRETFLGIQQQPRAPLLTVPA